MGWILGFFADEADASGAIAGVWDGNEVVLIEDAADLPSLLNAASFISEASGNTIVEARSTEGEFQQRFTDYDVRALKAEQTITLV